MRDNDNPDLPHVVAIGNPFDGGLWFHGPFENCIAACTWGEKQKTKSDDGADWWPLAMEPPGDIAPEVPDPPAELEPPYVETPYVVLVGNPFLGDQTVSVFGPFATWADAQRQRSRFNIDERHNYFFVEPIVGPDE